MSVFGQIKNGVVVLDSGQALPEGTRVRVELVDPTQLSQNLLGWAGKGVDLPEDLAHNHDHYLHGQAKK